MRGPKAITIFWLLSLVLACFTVQSYGIRSVILVIWIRSGVIVMLVQRSESLNQIKKIFDWMVRCDADKDGIVETARAGTGASETGPLRQKMKKQSQFTPKGVEVVGEWFSRRISPFVKQSQS